MATVARPQRAHQGGATTRPCPPQPTRNRESVGQVLGGGSSPVMATESAGAEKAAVVVATHGTACSGGRRRWLVHGKRWGQSGLGEVEPNRKKQGRMTVHR
jgi:hypothetical protein